MCIPHLFLQCFWGTFLTVQNASFPTGILSFAGARKGTQKTLIFAVGMHKHLDKIVELNAFHTGFDGVSNARFRPPEICVSQRGNV